MLDAQLSINLFDAVVFGFLAISAVLSLFRGFIREMLSLLVWVGAALITLHNIPAVNKAILPYVESDVAALTIAALGTYFLSVFSISVFSALILRYIKSGSDVGSIDNLMGLAFGLVKGWLIITLAFLIMALVTKEEGYPEWVKTSYSAPAVESSAMALKRVLPEYLQEIFKFDEEGQLDDSTIELDSDDIGGKNGDTEEDKEGSEGGIIGSPQTTIDNSNDIGGGDSSSASSSSGEGESVFVPEAPNYSESDIEQLNRLIEESN